MVDLFASVHENGLNGAIRFMRSRAPFLFNYASPTVKPKLSDSGVFAGYEEEWLACEEVPFSPIAGMPRFRRLPPMTLPGMPIQLPYSVQITNVTIDFHPGNRIDLPPEVQPPLADQAFAIEVGVAFGFACIPQETAVELIQQSYYAKLTGHASQVLQVKHLQCSKLRVVAVGHLTTIRTDLPDGTVKEEVRVVADDVEIVDIRPVGLENALECYIRAMLAGWILPNLVLALEPIALNVLNITSLERKLSPGLPHNPAIAQDALSVWLDVKLG